MRKVLGQVTKEELDSMDLIKTKLGTAETMVNMSVEGSDKDKKLFVGAVIDTIGNYKFLEKDWWNSIINKYDLPKDTPVYLSFGTGELYLNE